MGLFSKMALPPLALEALMYLAQQPPSSEPFKQRLVIALKMLIEHCFGEYMTPEQISRIFTKKLIEFFVERMGMDVVAYAYSVMQQEGQEGLLALGDYPITWTEAIAEGLRHMSWLMYSTYITREEFDERYPPELYVLFTEFNGLDKLQ
jgi:hypothetical protein